MDEVKVLEIRFVGDGRSLRAFVDIQFGELIIREFRITHKPGQKMAVSPPITTWKDPATGQIKYKGIVTFPPEKKQAIDLAILHAYREEEEKRNVREPQI